MSRGRKNGLSILAAACAAAVLLLPALSMAQEVATRAPTRAFHLIDSSTDRTPAKTSFPGYPRIARRDRIEGDATVCFKIDIDGRIRSVRVKNYSHRIFRRPAIRAIKASSFEPLKPNEIYSTARTCRIYRFRLEPIVANSNP